MSFAIFGAVMILACWKWGDWRHWEKYYPTILYLMVGDLTADLVFYNHPLWAYGKFIEQYPVLDICMMMLLYPGTVILYLSHYPKPMGKQALYVLLWTAIYVAAEFAANNTHGFCYHNGWNIWYSVLFDLIMFPLLVLHHKKPLYVWPISTVLCFTLLWWFRIPLIK